MELDRLLLAMKGPVWEEIVETFPCKKDGYNNCTNEEHSRAISECERWWITIQQRNKTLKGLYRELLAVDADAAAALELVVGKEISLTDPWDVDAIREAAPTLTPDEAPVAAG